MDNSGNNLIFLISQPRSGSSMLQQLLNSHPGIMSLPEPWLMLPLVYSYKYPGIDSKYNSEFANVCLMDYLKRFRDGTETYKRGIRQLAMQIYGLALQTDRKASYFLDKTPRYYHIISELVDLFQDAKFILLARNPAAVFASILDYNYRGNHIGMLGANDRIEDIFTGPFMIFEAREKYGDRVFYLRYEDLIIDSEKIMSEIYGYLDLEAPDDPTRYRLESDFKNTTSIDTKSVHQHERPVPDYIDSWKNSVDTLQKKTILIDYMNMLPEKVISGLGYSRESIISQLKVHEVSQSIKPRHLQYFLDNSVTEGFFSRAVIRLSRRVIHPIRRSFKNMIKR